MENITTYKEAIASLLLKSKDNKEEFLKTLIFWSNAFNLQTSAGFIWAGTKAKMKTELNEVFDYLDSEKRKISGKGYDTFVDVFGGALNSTLVLMESLKVSGVKNFIINDIDRCIVQTHRDYKENPNEMIEEFSEIIRTKFILKYGTIFLEKKDFENELTIIREELREYQMKEEYSVKSSIRFILLRDLAFSGTVLFNDDGYHKFSNKIFSGTKIFPWFFKQITRINKFSKIYNDLDIKICNLDCFKLLNKEEIKNNPNALINLDPPYIEQLKKDSSQLLNKLKDLQDSDNLTFTSLKSKEIKEELKDCTVNYNQKFPHIELLELLPNYNFIYNNNSHLVIDYANKIINAHSNSFDRKEVMSSKKGQQTPIVKEIILFKNSLN